MSDQTQCETCGERYPFAECNTTTVQSGPNGEVDVLTFCPDCSADDPTRF